MAREILPLTKEVTSELQIKGMNVKFQFIIRPFYERQTPTATD